MYVIDLRWATFTCNYTEKNRNAIFWKLTCPRVEYVVKGVAYNIPAENQ